MAINVPQLSIVSSTEKYTYVIAINNIPELYLNVLLSGTCLLAHFTKNRWLFESFSRDILVANSSERFIFDQDVQCSCKENCNFERLLFEICYHLYLICSKKTENLICTRIL